MNGQITIDTAEPGIYGILQASLATTPSLQGFSLNANFQFEINTTSVNQTVIGFLVNPSSGQTTANQSVTIQPGVQVDAGGQLAILGSFTVGGEFDLSLNANGLALNVNATLNVFGITLAVIGDAEIYYGSQAGLILDIGVNGSIYLPLSLGNLSGNAEVDINTIDGVYDVSITNVSASLLGLSASGSASITDNQGDVRLSGNLNVNFLNIVNIAFSGYYDTNGSFSFTASAGFTLDLSGLFGVGFTGTVSISNQGFSSSIYAYLDVLGITTYGSASLSYQGGAFYISVNIDGVNLVNVYLGSSTPPTDNIEIQSFSVPAQGTEEQAIATSATVVDPDYSAIVNNGEGENMTVTWTVTKNGQPFYPYTQAQGNEHYTTIFYGSGTSTFSFVPDDAGTYQVTASVEKYIFNFSNGGSVQFIGPVTSVGTVVVAGLPPCDQQLLGAAVLASRPVCEPLGQCQRPQPGGVSLEVFLGHQPQRPDLPDGFGLVLQLHAELPGCLCRDPDRFRPCRAVDHPDRNDARLRRHYHGHKRPIDGHAHGRHGDACRGPRIHGRHPRLVRDRVRSVALRSDDHAAGGANDHRRRDDRRRWGSWTGLERQRRGLCWNHRAHGGQRRHDIASRSGRFRRIGLIWWGH